MPARRFWSTERVTMNTTAGPGTSAKISAAPETSISCENEITCPPCPDSGPEPPHDQVDQREAEQRDPHEAVGGEECPVHLRQVIWFYQRVLVPEQIGRAHV